MAARSVTVDGFTVKETTFGGVVVAYSCPECEELLRSPVSDIGKDDECPNCQCAFCVPGEEAFKEYQRVVKDEESQKREAEIQKQKEAKIQIQKDTEIPVTSHMRLAGSIVTAPFRLVWNFVTSPFILMPFLFALFMDYLVEVESHMRDTYFVIWFFAGFIITIMGNGSSRRSSSSERLLRYMIMRDAVDRMEDRHND